MRFSTCLAAFLCLSGIEGCATEFPIRDAQGAINIAKNVCGNKVDPSLKWQADWDSKRQIWVADTALSIRKSGDPLWYVEIPVNGPHPSFCDQALYDLLI